MAQVNRDRLDRHHRFPLSPRMVDDLLAARGIIFSHQTVRLWAGKFGLQFAERCPKAIRR